MSFKVQLFSGAALAALVIVPSQAAAQGDAAPSGRETVTVTGKVLYADQVTALRSPTPIIDVPQSLTIVTADEIAVRGFDSLGDIVDFTPGVNMSSGEGHRDAVVFRGVRSTADFFVDGVRDDIEYYRPLYNLEQVEILRGPNALLFGRGGTGGILNRVTKKPDLDGGFTEARVGVNTFGGYSLQLDANRPVDDKTGFRLNAYYESLSNHRDFFDGDQIGLNPTLRLTLSPATRLDLSYEYFDQERHIDRGVPTGSDGRPVEAFRDIVFGDPELDTTELQSHVLRANLEHRFSDRLKSTFSAVYGDYDKLYQNIYPAVYDQAANPDRIGLDGYVDTTERRSLIVSGNLIGEFETGAFGHTIVAGAEYIDTVNDNDRFNPVWSDSNDDVEFFTVQRPLAVRGGVGTAFNGNPTTVAFSDLNDDTEADVSVFSAYIQDEIEVSDHLDIILGARFDRFEIDVLDVVTGVRRNRTDEKVSPRLGVIVKPVENLSLYASYSESFLPRSGDQFPSINDATAALDPDEFANLEAGVKWDIMERVSFTAALFEIEQTSPQTNDNDPSTLDVIDSEITGFEAQLQGHVTDRWFVSAGYSSLDGEIVNRNGPTGLRLRELPETMFSLWNSFQVTDALGLGLGLTHQGESFMNTSNTAVLPSYTRVDAAAFYDVNERLRLQLNIENLTDELYFPNSHATHEATVAPPLHARFTVTSRF